MKVTFGKAARGIFIILAFASFLLASCSLDSIFTSDRTGEVEVSLSIPPNIADAALPPALGEALVPPGSAASRFIHPDTRFVEVTLSLNGGPKTMSGTASVQAGASSASVSIKKVPMGEHRVTISLYDTSTRATLLSRGSSDISVRPKGVSRPSITAVPITRSSFNPGPFDGAAHGTALAAPIKGEVYVYRIAVPKTGPYMFRAVESSGKNTLDGKSLSLYDAAGKRLVAEDGGSYSAIRGIYASIPAGDCYGVVAVNSALGTLNISLDADLRLTASGKTIPVDPGLTAMDRTRPFAITVPCGYDPAAAIGVNFGNASNRFIPVATLPGDQRTINVNPMASVSNCSLDPYTSPSASAFVDFTDGLLGIQRTGTAFFDLPGAPRTFIYCNATGSKPSDSSASTTSTLVAAINAVNAVSVSVPIVIALLDGETYACSQIGITTSACILGGCDANGLRGAAYSSNQVVCQVRQYGLSLSLNAPNSSFSGLDFVIPAGSVSTSGYFFSIAGEYAKFEQCSFTYASGTFTVNSASPITYSTLYITAQSVSFDRCSIIHPATTLSGGGAHSVSAIQDLSSIGNDLEFSNSIVNAGNFASAVAANYTFCGINMSAMTGGYLIVAGSTISSGLVSGGLSAAPYMRAIQINPGTSNYLYLANSLLLTGDLSSQNSAFVYSTGSLGLFSFQNMALGYANGYGSINSSSRIIYLGTGTEIHYPDWSTSAYASNLLSALSNLALASTIPTDGDRFLRPSSASPSYLLSGGADLSVSSIRSATNMTSFLPAMLLLDRSGAARTGNGSTGYSIGAYEFD